MPSLLPDMCQLHQIESYLFTVAALPIEISVCSLSVTAHTDIAHL